MDRTTSPLTLQALRSEPGLIAELHARARRERAAFAHRVLARGLARLKCALQGAGSVHVSGRAAEG